MKSVTTITIGEKEVGLRFGYDCMKEFTTACLSNISFSSIDSIAGASKLLEAAHHNYCIVKEIDSVVSYEEVYEWVEEKKNEGKDEEISTLLNMWGESVATKKTIERMEEQKKSLPTELKAVV